ncbi:aminotransferase class V-fold PLP-dependent enzyme [Geomonas paludis]|uniref:Aminotransferase V n=1 Tax=Geomonas paludis TaxID=2740185 RepID=A0A6V8MWU1_9BACT|nr:aminotransferase class V-fold PLP-dependent enzyme [Geomonas paludis]UPU34312.1 aminotransferase class V-fold PLP-dependent enzyme [Geomonas paludis]GFO64294.1 aminotransferase V [Geomonas paludis]
MPPFKPTFKIASTPAEFDQIHRLNYRTFVEEIPQHPANHKKMLVDKFHEDNTYCICLDGERLIGMIAIRGKRPFSLDSKVPDLDRWIPPAAQVCEMRLLAVLPEYRGTAVFAGLIHFAASECIRRGFTMGLASGTLRQTRLYRRMGFVPFGDPVGSAAARFQPMSLTLHTAVSLMDRLRMDVPELPAASMANFLPGPVKVSPAVQAAFAAPPLSHRSSEFLDLMAETRSLLCRLTAARHVQCYLGSGTLGNDVVAAHLKVEAGMGVVLSNGEFGDRLFDHAQRMGLEFKAYSVPWGETYDIAAIEDLLVQSQATWLWTTHCETSSGILNDVERLSEMCRRRGVALCLDCTSSLGTVPVDLSRVFLASSVSGKGLASVPGLALVFYNDERKPDHRIPRYLDLGYYGDKQGVPFTHSSNLLKALNQALRELEPPRRFREVRRCQEILRKGCSDMGLEVTAKERVSSPAVLSIRIPAPHSSLLFGEALERKGFILNYRSEYLVRGNIVQPCLMGQVTETECRALIQAIASLIAVSRPVGTHVKAAHALPRSAVPPPP